MTSRELVSTRTVPYPPAALYAAFADPARLARWWGPAGATNEFQEFDLRPGGRWRLTMRMPDGSAYPMEKTFVEANPPRRVAVAHAQAGHDFTLTMDYEAVPGGTRLTWRTRFATEEQLAAVEKAFAAANEQNFDRLAQHLAATAEAPAILLQRTFRAPREKVFRAWTDPEALARWWSPRGMTPVVRTVDARPGGAFHFGMRDAEGRTIWGLARYREVVPPERLVYVDSFADEAGRPALPSAYGMSASHPAETLVTVTFEETPGGTLVTLRHEIPMTTHERPGAVQGWSEMLDLLGAALEE